MDNEEMMGKIARGAKMFQEHADKMKDDIRALRAEGESGGGWVRVLVNGERRVLRVEIADEAMQDKEMLQDLVASAVSDANRKVDAKLADMMRSVIASDITTELTR